MQLLLSDEAATQALAEKLSHHAAPGDVLLLEGPLGAGKTSFCRAFIRARMGDPACPVPSPTFTLVQSYEAEAATIWHYDLWRLTDHHALEELGWDEAQSGIVLVEWPDRLGPLIPPRALRLSFAYATPGRVVTLAGKGKFLDAT